MSAALSPIPVDLAAMFRDLPSLQDNGAEWAIWSQRYVSQLAKEIEMLRAARRPAPAWTQAPITEPGLYAYHTGKLIGWLEVEKDHNDGNLYSLRVFDTTAQPMAEMNEAFTRDGWHRKGPLDLGRPEHDRQHGGAT